jgi:hypothetical protein
MFQKTGEIDRQRRKRDYLDIYPESVKSIGIAEILS